MGKSILTAPNWSSTCTWSLWWSCQRSSVSPFVVLQDFKRFNGQKLIVKTESNVQSISESLSRLGRTVNTQKQALNFNTNVLNKFVENGYEVHKEMIDLTNWWDDKVNSKLIKIFFNKDYSSKPQVFYTISAIDQFHISEKEEKPGSQEIQISVEPAEIMTSYFTVKLKHFFGI